MLARAGQVKGGWITLAVAALTTSAVVAASEPAAPGTLPPGPGRQQVQEACAGCHALGIVTGKHATATDWGKLVDVMIDRGAPVKEADYDVVVAYLAKNFGPPK